MTTAPAPSRIGERRRWAMLGASTTAQAAAAVTIHGPAFLIPALRADGLSLPQAGLLAAAPTIGVVLALIAWGLVADRRGERLVLLLGLALTTVTGLGAVLADGPVLLFLALLGAGLAAASTGSASGRVVVGWFPPHRRGLAMGVRQMAQPVGVGVAAVTIAAVADRYGVAAALLVPVVAAALAWTLVALVVLDPPRPPRPVVGKAANPYRADGYLGRVHGVSMLLVVPQFTVWTFTLVWLVDDRSWSPAAAGLLVGAAQVAGALGRIAAGQLSDVVRSRLRPLRWVAVAAAAVMVLLGLTAGLDGAAGAVAVPLVVLATVLTVADNGLAFTAVAERAGPFWSGRALGAQNTAQYLTASLVPPVVGLVVQQGGYATAFLLAAVFPVLAVPLVPVRRERPLA